MQRWNVDKNLQRCLCCGSHVTPEFRRGYGDQEDRAHRCKNCDVLTRLDRGSAAGLEVYSADPLDEPERFGGSFEDLEPQVRVLCQPVATDGGESS